MKLFIRLPGFERAPAGVEWALIRRLPLIVVLDCLIVVIAKGPAYVADAYPLPDADAPLS